MTDTPSLNSSYVPEHVKFVASLMDLMQRALVNIEGDREAARSSIASAASLLQGEMQVIRQDLPTPPQIGALAPWQIKRVAAHIEANLSGPISTRDLGLVARRSTAHFCRSFRKSFGQTPHAYVLERRVRMAMHLMRETDEQLSVIAIRCGFADQPHLTRVFRLANGQTPAIWRRQHSAGPAAASRVVAI